LGRVRVERRKLVLKRIPKGLLASLATLAALLLAGGGHWKPF
jgi:hypothetical protein